MLLFVGLGNPDLKYAKNRHNIGFMAVDAIAEAYSFEPFKAKHHGLVSEGRIGSEKILLLKPTTFMNKSGVSVADAANFYKLEGDQIVVFYDELDLPHGKLRMRTGGGLAGHNGLRSIKAHMGADFRRARLGIGHPGDKAKVTLRYRGREMAHQEIGMELLKRVEVDLSELGTVEQFPKMEGRQLIMVIAPKKRS